MSRIALMDADTQKMIEALLEPPIGPVKSYTQLLREGVQHKGGLAMLAAAEKLKNPPAAIAGLAVRFPPLALVRKP